MSIAPYRRCSLISRVKGCRASNSPLAGASGLQYLISNHEQILADTVYRQFEIPLLEALDHYKLVTADRLVGYEKSLHEQSSRIRKTEAENLKGGRRRKRGQLDRWDIRVLADSQTCNSSGKHWQSCRDRWTSWMRSKRDITKRCWTAKTTCVGLDVLADER